MNSKVEKLLAILMGYLILIIHAQIIVPTGIDIFWARIISISSTTIITISIYYWYVRERNKSFKKRILKYLLSNRFQECEMYLDKCISKYKKLMWLQYERFLLIAMSGKMTEFNEQYKMLPKDNNVYEKNYHLSVVLFKQLFDFLNFGKKPECVCNDIDSSGLVQIVHYLSQIDKLDSLEKIEKLYIIYNTPYSLFKSVSAMLLCEEYKYIGQNDYYNTYYNNAKRFAPSDEVLLCVNNYLEKIGE